MFYILDFLSSRVNIADQSFFLYLKLKLQEKNVEFNLLASWDDKSNTFWKLLQKPPHLTF